MKTNKLLLSMLALCLCTVVVIGATYALFTDTVTVNNHLSAGNLKVGLHRISFKETTLGDSGLLEDKTPNTDRIDLTLDNSKVFNILGAVPESIYTAEIEVSNHGTVAFDYGVRVLWAPNDDPDDTDEDFAEQLEITIKSEKLDAPVTFLLSECQDKNIDLGFLLWNKGVETFTVEVKFLSLAGNNNVRLGSIDFDIQVYATQKTEA